MSECTKSENDGYMSMTESGTKSEIEDSLQSLVLHDDDLVKQVAELNAKVAAHESLIQQLVTIIKEASRLDGKKAEAV